MLLLVVIMQPVKVVHFGLLVVVVLIPLLIPVFMVMLLLMVVLFIFIAELILSVIASFGDMEEQLLSEVLLSPIVSYREDIPEQETSPLIL